MLLCCANLPLAKPGGRPGESALRLFGAEMGNAPLRSLRREALRFPALQPPLFSLLFLGPKYRCTYRHPLKGWCLSGLSQAWLDIF
jgi:hypothetical protein